MEVLDKTMRDFKKHEKMVREGGKGFIKQSEYDSLKSQLDHTETELIK